MPTNIKGIRNIGPKLSENSLEFFERIAESIINITNAITYIFPIKKSSLAIEVFCLSSIIVLVL